MEENGNVYIIDGNVKSYTLFMRSFVEIIL